MPVTRTPDTTDVVQLGTAAAALLPATPSGTKRTFNNVSFCNVSAANAAFTVHKVPSAGTADDTNIVIPPCTLAPGQTYVPQPLVGAHLKNGQTLQALADTAASINVDLNYYDTIGSP